MGKPGLSATVRVLSMAFFRKVITRHDTGLGEAYMDADFEVLSRWPQYTHGPPVDSCMQQTGHVLKP